MSDYNIAPYSGDAMPQQISPEGAAVANTYLANGCSINDTSRAMGIPTIEIASILKQSLIKQYVNQVLRETGFRHMSDITKKLDALIVKKLDELEEADIGSNKDIADLLQMQHKMQMDLARLIQADEDKGPGTINNTQINTYGEGAYGKLMEKLIKG